MKVGDRDCWDAIDKDEEEGLIGKRTGLGVRKLKEHVTGQIGIQDLTKIIVGDSITGLVFVRLEGHRPSRVFEKQKSSEDWVLHQNHINANLVKFDLKGVLEEINFTSLH